MKTNSTSSIGRRLVLAGATLLSVASFALAIVTAAAQHGPGHSHGSVAARTYKAGNLVITAPWVRATPRGAPVAGGYLSITNNGSEPDRLIGGSFAASGRFEVHVMSMDGGVMRMRPAADGLEIKPGQTVEFKPGGLHLMFLELKRQLKAGDTVKGTLEFAKAGKLEIAYPVRPMGVGGGGHKHH
jgi:periplasmic copper chaperone A